MRIENYLYFCEINIENMETVLEKRKDRTQRINYNVSALKKKRSDVSENGPKMIYLRTTAQKLDSSMLDNNITMQEIVDEVNTARKELYEKQNRI